MDKWIKSEEEEDEAERKAESKKKKNSTKNKPKSKASPQESKALTSSEKTLRKFNKYVLICPKKSCGYQKTLMKKQLNDKDMNCPRCKSVMKIKKA